MSAPERIWAYESKSDRGGREGMGCWAEEDVVHLTPSEIAYHPSEQYTRTDLIPAMIQAAVDAEREACALVAQSADTLGPGYLDDELTKEGLAARNKVKNIVNAIRARKGGVE